MNGRTFAMSATSAIAAVSAAAAIFTLLRTASRLQAENDRLKAEVAEHHSENARLQAEIAQHRSVQAACTNVDLWHPFEELLAVTPDHTLK
jgi:cell division protein FtsB